MCFFLVPEPWCYYHCWLTGLLGNVNGAEIIINVTSYSCTFPTVTSQNVRCEKGVRELTDKIQESERDQQVGSPVEAVGERECSSSDSSWKYFTQKKPGHWSKTKKDKRWGSMLDNVIVKTEKLHYLCMQAARISQNADLFRLIVGLYFNIYRLVLL